VTFLSPDTSWGGTVLKVYENNGNSAVLSAVSDTGDGWLGADSFNTINTSVGNLVNYGPAGLWLGRGRGSSTVRGDVLAGDGMGMIKFAGICQSGARFDVAGHIGCEVKEVGTYIGGNMVFGTKPMANSNPLYRMRLDADGGLVLRSDSTVDPTSGSMGPGTINATGLYVNGVAVSGGTPGGSDTQVQFNNSSAFGGSAGFTYNTTNLTVGLGGGTVTADDPVLDLTQTWNNAAVTFNGIKLNVTSTASATASKLLDLQVGGTTKFNVRKSGHVTVEATTGITSSNWTYITGSDKYDQTGGIAIRNGQLQIAANLAFGWSSTSDPAGNSARGYLDVLSTGLWRFTCSTSPGTIQLHNTYTDTSNYERISLTWSSNVCYLKPENAGTGSARLFVPVTGSTTVGSLPAAATAGAGARSFVTDANATTFLSTVAGGGANKVPVVSDGTNWLIG
jgi:hypothetical protein